jgi:hypothetical protein
MAQVICSEFAHARRSTGNPPNVRVFKIERNKASRHFWAKTTKKREIIENYGTPMPRDRRDGTLLRFCAFAIFSIFSISAAKCPPLGNVTKMSGIYVGVHNEKERRRMAECLAGYRRGRRREARDLCDLKKKKRVVHFSNGFEVALLAFPWLSVCFTWSKRRTTPF